MTNLPNQTLSLAEHVTVTIEVPEGYICPSKVDENTWVNSDTKGPYEFVLAQNGTAVTIQRSDEGVNTQPEAAYVFFDLGIYCCPKGNISINLHYLRLFYLKNI